MGFFSSKKEQPLLSSEDNDKLKEIEKIAYMEEATTLIKERGKQKARLDIKGKNQ